VPLCENLIIVQMASKAKSIPARYGLPEFSQLETSTSTVMVYTNVILDLGAIFTGIEITDVDVPLTKKQKNVDKKKITAPYGAIISVQSKTRIRGADIRKRSKHWCTICRPVKVVGDKEKHVDTVTEFLVEEEGTDIQNIMYHCSHCQKDYRPEEMKKINHFLNQITVVISIGKQPLLNVMLFKDNFKIAGCKDQNDSPEMLLVLWQDYISQIPGAWKLKPGSKRPKFAFEVVMRNVDFKLGFNIERKELNKLMNGPEFADKVYMSQYETTEHTNVNIKMYSTKPENFTYDCLVVPDESEPYFTKIPTIPFKNPKKKVKTKYITLIVFSSAEVILSGRYDENMKAAYEFFVHTAISNRKLLEERTRAPNKSEIVKIVRTQL